METRIFRILCVKSNGYPTLNSQPALESSNANFFFRVVPRATLINK